MNRVCLVIDEDGHVLDVASDKPIRFFVVNDYAPDDRVYELTPGKALNFGVVQVQSILRDDPVGHANDQHILGSGHGPRKPPSRPTLTLVP